MRGARDPALVAVVVGRWSGRRCRVDRRGVACRAGPVTPRWTWSAFAFGVGAVVVLIVLVVGCSALPTHKDDPQTCRERAAYRLAAAYPDPNNLSLALDTICQDQGTVP